MSGSDLVMGFDYGHSIKHQLPPGFRYAMKIATSMLDPGLYSDAYSDQPYLYGPALSSFFAFRIGDRTSDVSTQDQLASLSQESDSVIEEGASGSGKEVRKASSMPSKWKKRRKYYLDEQALSAFTFEKGRMYHADFFNPHLDFANFSLRLPGFSISVAKYVDEKTHHLRYVLRNRRTEEVLLVVFFKLLFGKELEDTLEKEKRRESASPAVTADKQPRREGTGHDELTKVCAAEDAERRASQPPPRTGHDELTKVCATEEAERRASQPAPRTVQNNDTSSSENPTHRQGSAAGTGARVDGGAQEDQSYISQATTAATNLANSVVAVYAALGFGNSSSSSSDSGASSSGDSPPPANKSMAAEIDNMDDETVEQYLRGRHGSA